MTKDLPVIIKKKIVLWSVDTSSNLNPRLKSPFPFTSSDDSPAFHVFTHIIEPKCSAGNILIRVYW